jgi:glycosyltransferase involved in cell wall biosynthesis
MHITVSESLAKIFTERYRKKFYVIRNVPETTAIIHDGNPFEKPYVLYQGVLNKGRGLEALIDAMSFLHDIELRIAGWGDIGSALKEQAKKSSAAQRIHFMGWLTLPELQKVTAGATLGINLLDGSSKSYQYSLANKFFDYMHAGVPSLNMDFPEYRDIIDQYPVGFLVNTLDPEPLAQYISTYIVDEVRLNVMKKACVDAARIFCWEQESLLFKDVFHRLAP